MAWTKFELKKEHIAMIKAIDWNENVKYIFLSDNAGSPFGGENLIEDLGLIIFGKPNEDFDPFSDNRCKYSPEQIKFMMDLYVDLPIALELWTQISNIEEGLYKKRVNQKNWVKKS